MSYDVLGGKGPGWDPMGSSIRGRVEKENETENSEAKSTKSKNRRHSVYDVKGNTSLGIQKVEAAA